jgi:hypothetical protein
MFISWEEEGDGESELSSQLHPMKPSHIFTHIYLNLPLISSH